MAPQRSAVKTTDIMPKFARVAINIAQIEELFDYAIPVELQPLQVGALVVVPFGKQNVQGIVVDLIDEPAVPDVKAIESLWIRNRL